MISNVVFITNTNAYFFIIPKTRNEPKIIVFIESNIMKGDAIFMTETTDGSFRIISANKSDEKKNT